MSLIEPKIQTNSRETESPRHGYQGDRAARPRTPRVPASLSIAVSREAGSRGHTIASRAAQKLGWPVYSQELLDFTSREPAHLQSLAEQLSGEALDWVERELSRRSQDRHFRENPSLVALVRTLLLLAAHGEVVLIGRGANYVLPRESTLAVRLVAPLDDRIAYMSQWLRLSMDEAAEQVRVRDRRRAEFLENHFHCQANDVYRADVMLNTGFLGEELASELIVQAARSKLAAWIAAQTANAGSVAEAFPIG